MLVRGRMEDNCRAQAVKDLPYPALVANIRNDRSHLHLGIAFPQLNLHVEDAVLAVSKQDQAPGARAGHLPA